jgi:hypothetical protein
MTALLSERLNRLRQRQFIGREPECSLLKTCLQASELPFAVLHIFGPGGVGKTTLLREFMCICQTLEIPVLYLDARNMDPSIDSFVATLKALMGLHEQTDLFQSFAAQQRDAGSPQTRQVMMIDTCELLTPLDDWLRESFLPQLPTQTLVILAGRQPPTGHWRSDPGWQELLHPLSLRNFSPEESRLYLTQRAIPPQQHAAVLAFTHGYPLALSLVADSWSQSEGNLFQPGDAPDVIKTLLDRFLEQVPSGIHRRALEASAIVRLTTESLLVELLEIPDVHDLFNWLQSLSFFESGSIGVFPHDLAREVLITDLRWRNPDAYIKLHQQARAYYSSRLEQTHGQAQHRLLFDYIFLHRDNPTVKPRFIWQEHSGLKIDCFLEGDRPSLLKMVATHEGAASSHLANYWFDHQPDGVWVIRDADQHPVGFLQRVMLHQDISALAVDPAAIACWNYLQHHAPLRAGEGATLFRFWMARDTYQAVSPVQSLIFITLVQYYRNTPNLAFTFLPCADSAYWADMFAYADLTLLPEAGFAVNERSYAVYGHDWRIVTPTAWQELLAIREITASATLSPAPQPQETLIVLSQAEFTEAVHAALRCFTRPERLAQNPLLRSRLVSESIASEGGTSSDASITVLKDLLREGAEGLRTSPRDEKFYQVLHRTYLQPAPTQEQAAELLDLPFSSYRRYLKTGVMRVAETLWQREIS